MDQSDETVVTLVQGGDKEAFGILITRYEEKMKRYAKRFLLFVDEGDAVVQDVFVKAYMHIQDFDTTKRFSPWLYRIAHNTFINEIKRKQKAPLPFFDTDTLFPHPVAEESSDDLARSKELKAEIEQSLETLPVKYREPLVLYFFEEMSYQDIAEILRIPTSTVGVRIKRAKDKLKTVCDKLETAYE